MAKCKICCSERMIVGRWYKLTTYPISSEAPIKYWAQYTLVSGNATLIHDTIYIKGVGPIVVSCVDIYGATDTVTIAGIEAPTIERTVHEVIPESWADLCNKIDAVGANAYINVPHSEYTFDMPATAYYLPSGVVVDFNGSIINVTTYVGDTEAYHGFRLTGAFSGIRNATFRGVDIGDGSSYRERTEAAIYEQCSIIDIYSGDHHVVENLTFVDVAGFNLTLGTWPAYWYFSPSGTASRWRADNSCPGYIADDGSVVESADAWTMQDPVEIITTPDHSYGVGASGMWLPTTVRLYDIAFYDVDGGLIELRKNQQYFRRYYYPENAKTVRYCVHQAHEPTEGAGRDDYCIMRMMGGNSVVDCYPTVSECVIDNIVHHGHCSGGFSGVGVAEDIHINRMMAPGKGWLNGWAFDIEDNWNAALGYVVSHSYFSNGSVFLHGAQGVSMVSCIMGGLELQSNVHYPTLINCLATGVSLNGVRGNATAINSYCGTIKDVEGHGNSYEFGLLDAAEAASMRTRMRYAIGK